jgi:predicted metal-dependent hydrolase
MFKLKYSRQAKYMRLQISRGNELEVILPRGYQLKDAEDFLLKKSGWIKKHLSKCKPESEYFFLGKQIIIKEYYHLFNKKHKITFKDGVLEIISPEQSSVEISELYNAWLRHSAKKFLTFRVRELSGKYGFRVNRISVRGQKTRWGSCSSGGNLSFNFRLMRCRHEVIDYVIIHELCHLKEMNHSDKFWKLVQSLCPDFKKLRKELKGR